MIFDHINESNKLAIKSKLSWEQTCYNVDQQNNNNNDIKEEESQSRIQNLLSVWTDKRNEEEKRIEEMNGSVNSTRRR